MQLAIFLYPWYDLLIKLQQSAKIQAGYKSKGIKKMTDETKVCPYCGEEILAVAKKCKHCGEFLPAEPVQNENKTKTCPYCGEEILAVAKKCKHCGEFLDENVHPDRQDKGNQRQTGGSRKFQNVDVNDKWKKRFEAVDKIMIDGKWWHYNPTFWKTSLSERAELNNTIYFSDILSTLSAILLGGFYYLFKGMWLKFLIYAAICIILAYLTEGYGMTSFWIIFVILAPCDYYRLKVLGKQW